MIMKMIIRIIMTQVKSCTKKSVIASLKIQQKAIIAMTISMGNKVFQEIFGLELGL